MAETSGGGSSSEGTTKGPRRHKRDRFEVYKKLLLTLLPDGISLKDFTRNVAKALDQNLTDYAVKSNLVELRKKLEEGGYKLRIGKTIRFERDNASGFAQQASDGPELKKRLGNLLWWLLFGIGERQDCSVTHDADVLPKVAALRRKPLATFLFDAGSTVHIAASALLDSPMPLKIQARPFRWGSAVSDEPRGEQSLISIRFVTNSLPVINLCSSNRHDRLPEPIFVGGQYRRWSESVGGLLAEASLREWNLRFDVAIIGTAGYAHGPDGGFGSDVVDEAQTKLLFLSRAALRVVLCHSAKLRSHPATIFAPLNPANVDLIVTDDGYETGCEEDVAEFRADAQKANVAVVILKTLRRKTGGRPTMTTPMPTA